MQIHDVHQSHDRFLCVTRSTLRTLPHPAENHSLRVFLPSFFLFSFALFSRRTAAGQPSAERGPLSLRVLACKTTFVRSDAPAFGVVQARQARRRVRISELHVASVHSLQTYCAIRFKISTRRPPPFLFFSLIQHGTHDECPHYSIISCLEKKYRGCVPS